MPRILILLLSMFLLAACDHADVGDPTKPHPRLLSPGAPTASTAGSQDQKTDATANDAGATATAAAGHEPAQPPEDFVREFFTTYIDAINDGSWFENRDVMSTWFNADLTHQLLANYKACQNVDSEACRLDFDPIIDAQDNDDDVASTLHTERMGTGTPVRVKVEFTNLGSRKTMTYTLIQAGDGWKISDVQSPSYGSLSSLLSSNGEPAI